MTGKRERVRRKLSKNKKEIFGSYLGTRFGGGDHLLKRIVVGGSGWHGQLGVKPITTVGKVNEARHAGVLDCGNDEAVTDEVFDLAGVGESRGRIAGREEDQGEDAWSGRRVFEGVGEESACDDAGPQASIDILGGVPGRSILVNINGIGNVRSRSARASAGGVPEVNHQLPVLCGRIGVGAGRVRPVNGKTCDHPGAARRRQYLAEERRRKNAGQESNASADKHR